jgi:hypothetical protein
MSEDNGALPPALSDEATWQEHVAKLGLVNPPTPMSALARWAKLAGDEQLKIDRSLLSEILVELRALSQRENELSKAAVADRKERLHVANFLETLAIRVRAGELGGFRVKWQVGSGKIDHEESLPTPDVSG